MAGIGTPNQSASTTIGTVTANIQDSAGNSLTSTGGALNVNASISLSNYALESGGNLAKVAGAFGIPGSPPVVGTAGVVSVYQDVSGNLARVGITQPLPTQVLNAADSAVYIRPGTGVNLDTADLALETGGNLATLAGAVADSKVNINISSGSIANTSFAVTQGTASNLKAEAHLYDSSTNGIGSTGNALDVNIKSGSIANTSFASTIADGASVTLGAKADAKSAATDTTAVTIMQVLKEISYMEQNPASRAVTFTGSTDVATQTTLSAINTKLVGGTDIGDVTINNSTGGSAVNIQDGGNTITVDGTVSANATLAAETTKVIGVTRGADGSGNLLTSTSNALDVNIKSSNLTSLTTGAISNAAAATNDLAALTAGVYNATQPTITDGRFNTTQLSARGELLVAPGTSGFSTQLTPSTAGGLSVGNFTTGDSFTALTHDAQVIKASAGLFYGYYIYNPNTAATYVEVYNVAAASVTVGTTNPLLVFCIPASSAANLALPFGITFDTAMSIAATTTGGGNTAPATDLEAMVWYK